jgi:hypothetical protein
LLVDCVPLLYQPDGQRWNFGRGLMILPLTATYLTRFGHFIHLLTRPLRHMALRLPAYWIEDVITAKAACIPLRAVPGDGYERWLSLTRPLSPISSVIGTRYESCIRETASARYDHPQSAKRLCTVVLSSAISAVRQYCCLSRSWPGFAQLQPWTLHTTHV